MRRGFICEKCRDDDKGARRQFRYFVGEYDPVPRCPAHGSKLTPQPNTPYRGSKPLTHA
jgi:hypothetical protein